MTITKIHKYNFRMYVFSISVFKHPISFMGQILNKLTIKLKFIPPIFNRRALEFVEIQYLCAK